MSTRDTPHMIEDEPYEGLYRAGSASSAGGASVGIGHLPDRFDLAVILKAQREKLGLSLEDVAEVTRVRRAYLEAFEQAAYDILPPRAFAIGYIKAYAKALGLDEESLADMYKREVSEPSVRLHAPSGASLDDVKPNYRAYITAAACLVAAIFVWNVFQRQPLSHARRTAEARLDSTPWKFAIPNIRDGSIHLTKPAPAPQDQDVPAPYVTPGLEEGFALMMAEQTSNSAAPVPVIDVLQTRKAFNPQGAVYGVQPAASSVTIQATRSLSLTVRDGQGAITFAQQLNAGEAYRLPAVDQQDMQIEVSDFKHVDVFFNGEYAGKMDVLVTTAGKLNARAAQLASAMDERQAQSGQVASVYVATPKPQAPTAAPRPTDPIPYLPAVRPPSPPPVEVQPETPAAPATTTTP